MRGLIISAVGHVLFVALTLLATPRLFDDSTRPVEVELVRPEEVEAPKDEPKKEEPKKDARQDVWDVPAEKPAPWPEAKANPPQPSPPPSPAESAKPDNSQQAALSQPSQPSPSEAPTPSPAPAQAQPAQPSIFDPANIPTLLNLPNAPPDFGFDAEATRAADLNDGERSAFKAHLRKCWKLPGNVSPTQNTRVVLRIYLRRDGRLAAEPVLIEASASRDGPVVMQTALRALKECQPYGFLPSDKYSEWKVLDLSFTPRDMAGG